MIIHSNEIELVITYCSRGRQVGKALLRDGDVFSCFSIDQGVCSVILVMKTQSGVGGQCMTEIVTCTFILTVEMTVQDFFF